MTPPIDIVAKEKASKDNIETEMPNNDNVVTDDILNHSRNEDAQGSPEKDGATK